MTNSNERLVALAERCEAAAGPDRDLDFDVLCIADPRAIKTGPIQGDPTYTASLDAAMTLVPEGWAVDQLGEWDALKLRDRGPWTALLNRRGDSVGSIVGRCNHAATAPLALCAAALRALASLPAKQEPSQ